MWTRDRIRLDADVYAPDAEGTFPVLLMRQPYGRAIASTVVYAYPTWYAAHGFIVVIQDVRGRGTSEGEFRLFEHEVEDGYDSVEWAAQLPQSNGKVGMYGFSYQGMTQLFAAQAQPPALQAIAPAMVGYHPYSDWAYENGALLLQAGIGWAIQLAAETARLRGDAIAFQALYQAARNLPTDEEFPACPTVLQQHAPDSFFHDWLQHPQPDEYWDKITPHLAEVDLPMLHIGGWFDPYLRGDLRLYQEMVSRSQYPQPLWIGPWGHLPWGRVVGGRDFGKAANSPIDALQVRWFREHLPSSTDSVAFRGIGTHATVFAMGANQWLDFSQWPPPSRVIEWLLLSDGLASLRESGRLIPQLENTLGVGSWAEMEPDWAELGTSVEDTWVHDPWRPVPAIGGHAAIPAGAFDRAAVDCRSDVVTYTSRPLQGAMTIAGTIEVQLQVECDRPSFDLSVTLSEVTITGQVYPLTQGYRRCDTPNETEDTYSIQLQATCFSLTPGHALRLSISAACFPAYVLNPGTGAPTVQSTVRGSEITTLTLRTGENSQTRLFLPMPRVPKSPPNPVRVMLRTPLRGGVI
jgi:putative CocE/NonD family hydrolase